MLGHWLWAQRLAREHVEERASWVRAVALHLAWAVPWMMALYALLDVVKRALQPLFVAPDLLAESIDWRYNLTVIVVNGLVGAFFARLTQDESGAAQRALRRLQGWLWTLHAVALSAQGVYLMVAAWLQPWYSRWPQGIAWFGVGVLVGLAVLPWWRRWKGKEEERVALIHAGLTLLLGLTGVTVVVLGLMGTLSSLFEALLGLTPWDETLRHSGMLFLGRVLPWAGVVWVMGRTWRILEAAWPAPRGRLWRARAEALIGLVGLALASMGLAMLWRALWQALLEGLGAHALARGLAFAMVGWPLWWSAWRSLQRDAHEESPVGRAVRRSLGRRGLLYAALLGSVLTLMVASGALVYHFLLLLLAGEHWPALEWLTMVGNGLIALGVGALHWAWLRQDHAWEAHLERNQWLGFHVWLLSDGTSPLLGLLQERLRLLAPAMPVHWHDLSRGLPESDQPIQAVVLLGHTLASLNDTWRLWMERFTGAKLVLPAGGPWVWVGTEEGALEELLETAVRHLQTLALGEGLPTYERFTWWQALLGVVGLGIWASFWAGFLLG